MPGAKRNRRPAVLQSYCPREGWEEGDCLWCETAETCLVPQNLIISSSHQVIDLDPGRRVAQPCFEGNGNAR